MDRAHRKQLQDLRISSDFVQFLHVGHLFFRGGGLRNRCQLSNWHVYLETVHVWAQIALSADILKLIILIGPCV